MVNEMAAAVRAKNPVIKELHRDVIFNLSHVVAIPIFR